MGRMKKSLSIVLTVCLLLSVLFSALSYMGITASAASVSSYAYRELWLLNEYGYALSKGSRTEINGEADAAPYDLNNRTAYLPLSALCQYRGASWTLGDDGAVTVIFSGKTYTLKVGEYTYTDGTNVYTFEWPVAERDSEVYITILFANSLFGTRSFYNSDMGLTVLSTSSLSYSKTQSSLATQIATLSQLLFERPSGDTVYNDVASSAGIGTHPRLLADQATFDSLREQYELGFSEEVNMFDHISKQVATGEAAYNAYFTTNAEGVTEWKSETARLSLRQPYYLYDEHGNRLVGETAYSYYDENGEYVTLTVDGSGLGDGYDVGGRSNVSQFTSRLKYLAFAWQMTGEQRYADAFYLLTMELAKWEHWGEGHFLNVADGAVELAIGLDWIYHAFDSEPQKRDEMAAVLYEKGMMKGYYAIVCDSLYSYSASHYINGTRQYGTHSSLSGNASSYLSISKRAGTSAWRTINRENNWQTVCGSGMIISALYLLDYEDYSENARFVIEQYLLSNEKCLLQYAPDGAYIESPGYWGYGTNAYMLTIAALESAAGKSYGLADTVGLRDSFYFAAGICNSDYRMWNYHDSGDGEISAKSFYLASRLWSDPSLAAYRDGMIFNRNKLMEIEDVIFYSPELSEGAESLPLDNNFKGIDTATFRSSWDYGSVYTGLHTGPNNVTHGDFDCGNFILSMGGVNWVRESGTEDYNVSGFWSSGEYGTRYRLYGKSLEGHSTVLIRNNSSLPLGQRYTSFSGSYAKIDEFYSDELGGYAISDMTYQYGSSCSSAKRGVLLTNSRTTVVLQDEISFSSATDLTWLLHLNNSATVNISEDGRTIIANRYLDENVFMRMTLLSDDDSLRFRLLKTAANSADGRYETVLPDTKIKANENNDGMENPNSHRVVIEKDGALSFNVAVVFQLFENEAEIVPYEYTPMEYWTTSDDEWVKEANKDIMNGVNPGYKYTDSHFRKAIYKLENAKSNDEIAAILRQTYMYLTSYNPDKASTVALAEQYRAYLTEYNLQIRKANGEFRNQFLNS